jgi:hypothetical protein
MGSYLLRSLGATLALLVLATGALPGFVPMAAAQTAAVVTVPDATGDVAAGAVNSPVPGPNPDALDIMEAKLYGENGEEVLAQVKLRNIKAEADVGTYISSGIATIVCFTWKDKVYAARVTFIYTGQAQVTSQRIGVLSSACNAQVAPVWADGQYRDRFALTLDAENSLLTFAIKRKDLAEFGKTEPPMPGEQLKDFKVYTHDVRRLRFDAAPNEGAASDVLPFTYPTANTDLKAYPDANVLAPIACLGRQDLPTYAIEAGGKRGIPIVFENPLGAPRKVRFEVLTTNGPDWKPKMMPGIELPAASASSNGNLTVNVIVDTPASTKHKECATIRVRALDDQTPLSIAETSVNVVAVSPPSRTQNKLYMHTSPQAANTCSNSQIWVNVLETDPGAADNDILMIYCRDIAYTSTAAATIVARIDVNPSHDLILNTSVTGGKVTATIVMRSELVDTNARLDVSLVTGHREFNTIGTGSKVVTITAAAKPFTIDIPVGFTRDQYAEGDPSRTIDARQGIGLAIRMVPLPVDPNANPVVPAGRVYVVSKGTQMQLPIWATVKRNVNDPGEQGGLLSLAPRGPLPQFAAPGAVRLFNFTVLNEGAAADAAQVSTIITGATGWTATSHPPGPYVLQPGESKPFQILLTPPTEARESETVILDVVVISQSDPTARASISATVVATREAGVPVELAPGVDAVQRKGGFLPGPEMALVAVAALLGLGRRRRL